MIVRNSRHKKLRISRRTLVLISVVILVLLGVFVTVRFGLISAADTKAKLSLSETKTKVTDQTTNLNALFADDKVTVGAKISGLSTYTTQLQAHSKDVCRDARSLVYYGLVKYHDNCEQASKAISALQVAANNLYSFLSDEETLATLLPTSSTSLSYTQQYDLWNRTTELLKAAKTSDQAVVLKTATTEATKNYAAAWYDLLQADNKKNEEAFQKAEELVKTTYNALKATSAISTKTLQDLTSAYNVAYTAYTSLTLTK